VGADRLAAALAERALAGERRAIARLLTLFDDDAPGAGAARRGLAARPAGRASSASPACRAAASRRSVNALLGAWLERGLQVACSPSIPSSPISGGRGPRRPDPMGEHGAHPNAFVRSFSARGELGGVSRAAAAAIDCLDAAGFDRVIVETVGTGQSETAIAALADSRVVVCPPGLGDDVQALKAGTLEIADVLAVSKGDLPLAEQTAREMRDMLGLRRRPRRMPGSRASSSSAPSPRAASTACSRRSKPMRFRFRRAGACARPRRRRSCPSPIRRRSRPTTPTAGAPACRRSPRATACAALSASRRSPAVRADRGGDDGRGAAPQLQRRLPWRRDLRARRQRLRPGVELARPARLRDRRAHHLSGRRP
jgi:putative protein kinase ArgK-like GTPase of G3E family